MRTSKLMKRRGCYRAKASGNSKIFHCCLLSHSVRNVLSFVLLCGWRHSSWQCDWLFLLCIRFAFSFLGGQGFYILRELLAPIVVHKSNDHFINFKLLFLRLRSINLLEGVWFQRPSRKKELSSRLRTGFPISALFAAPFLITSPYSAIVLKSDWI